MSWMGYSQNSRSRSIESLFYQSWGIKLVGSALWGRWTAKNVDIEVLCKNIQVFLEERGFEVKVERSQAKCSFFLILGSGRYPAKGVVPRRLTVCLEGNPNDFKIEFRGVDFMRPTLLDSLTLFIGNWFRLREMKLEDAIVKLENPFWQYVDKTIAQLSDSSKQI